MLQVGSDIQPSPKGRLVPFPPHDGFDRKTGKALPLSQMRGENILLTLPQGMFQVLSLNTGHWLDTQPLKHHLLTESVRALLLQQGEAFPVIACVVRYNVCGDSIF